MKNRLEIAKELLRDDGVIFVQCDDNEQAYLKVLMDGVFGRDNFVNTIVWKRKGGKTSPDAKKLENSADLILMFRKNDKFMMNFLFTKINSEEYIAQQFKYYDEDSGRRYRISPLNAPQPRPTLRYEFMGYKPHPNGWSVKMETLQKFYDEGKLVFPKNKDGRVNRKQYLDEWEGYAVNSLWDDISLIAASSSERQNFDRGQKPEKLLQRIIEMATNEGDIILDYHLGSGTTAAVAHKMGRRYIGIEQMDYIDDLVITRLKNVIGINKNNQAQLIVDEGYQDYDISGISKAVNWCGGGSFIYCELMQNNQIWVDKINHINESEQLIQLWQLMQDKAQLSYKVDISQINANINKFEHLSLEEQKRFLIEILDKNQLYVNYTEIDDVDYLVSDTDKQLNRKFYSMK